MLVNHQKTKMGNISQNTWLWDLSRLTLGLFVFYAFYLGGYPLFTPDEGRYSEIAREMVATSDYITPRVNGVAFLDKPALYYWLQAFAIHLFGVKEWALRLFPMLFGLLGCLMTYVCGRQLFDRRTGWIAAILLATAPLYFAGAHYANLDLEVAVLISCTLLCFITALESKTRLVRKNYLLAAYLFSALAVLTKGLIGVAFPCMIAGSWILLLWRFDLLKKIHLLKGILLFLLIVLPWYILVQKANPGFLHYFFVTQQFSRFLSEGVFNNKSTFWFYLPIIIIGFFPWTIFLIQALNQSIRRVWQARQQHTTELFLILWITIIFLFFSIPHSKIIGYITPIFPALALLVGRYLSQRFDEIINQKQDYFALGGFVVLSSLLAAIAFLLPYYGWLDVSAQMKPYAFLIAGTLLSSLFVAVVIVLKKKEKIACLFTLGAFCNVMILSTLILGASHLNQNSAKPLAIYLKTVALPEDEIITYFKYYHDVPLYLERRVTITANWNSPDIPFKDNWLRELWLGMSFQNTDAWLINEDTFWQRFDGSKRVYVLLNDNYFDQFKRRAKQYFILEKYNDIILLSNKPLFLSRSEKKPMTFSFKNP